MSVTLTYRINTSGMVPVRQHAVVLYLTTFVPLDKLLFFMVIRCTQNDFIPWAKLHTHTHTHKVWIQRPLNNCNLMKNDYKTKILISRTNHAIFYRRNTAAVKRGKVVALGFKSRWFESSYRGQTSPLWSSPTVVFPFLKNDVKCY